MPKPVNKFVLRTVSQSHGHVDHQLISTLAEFKELARMLHEKIELVEGQEERTDGNILFNQYVTLAPGRTERNSISFVLGHDLISYERATIWHSHIREYLSLSILAAVLILAGIGLITIVRFLLR